MQLPRTRLVVLSSCQSGAARYYQGEGMINLARPFLVARVPLVVATLWSVESDATAELMISFHRRRAPAKTSTAEALAEAQREMLRSSDTNHHHPYYWAPFSLFGGHASF
jgi:CHAT domain-containing protein